MKSKEIDVIKVQVFYRLPFGKTDIFEIYRNFVISFCLVQQRNTNLNLTPEQLQKLVKEQLEISCGCLSKYSEGCRLLVIARDAQKVFETFL